MAIIVPFSRQRIASMNDQSSMAIVEKLRFERWLHYRIFFVFLFFTIVFLLIYLYNIYTGELQRRLLLRKQPIPQLVNDSLPIILLWTPYFGGNWIQKDGFKTKCLENKCQLISNRAYLRNANAVLFHWKDVKLTDMPNVRYSDQKWVLYNMESPENTVHLKDTLVAIQYSIDWTMTYRLDSNVKSVYGYTMKLYDTPKRPMVSRKSKEIAWMVSNCKTPAKREEFVKALSAYLNIDIYGRCGHFKCPKDKYYECLQMVGDKYKFYLSFENSICKDYVTEKLFRIMAFDVIPIVFGGANYTQILPPHSFIDALAFSSPQKLADYVRRVSSNYTFFSSFFDWKTKYSVFTSIGYDLCFLCDKIVNNLVEKQTKNANKDLVKWWFTDAKCNSWN